MKSVSRVSIALVLVYADGARCETLVTVRGFSLLGLPGRCDARRPASCPGAFGSLPSPLGVAGEEFPVSDANRALGKLRDELRAELNRLKLEHKRLVEMLDRCCAQADRIESLLLATSDNLNAGAVPPPTAYRAGQDPSPHASPFEARYLSIIRNTDSSAQVKIDDLPPFDLPCDAADFLLQLASGSGCVDGLVEWKSRESLLSWIAENSRKKIKPKSLNQRVYSLRQRMRAAGIKRHLVHTHPRKGIRFAIRSLPGMAPQIIRRDRL